MYMDRHNPLLGASILVVEDDIHLNQSFTLLLHHAGYIVSSTTEASQAEKWISSGDYRLVIMDDQALLACLDHVSRMQDGNPSLIYLILTDDLRMNAHLERRTKNIQYMQKPVDPQSLLDNVKSLFYPKFI